MDFEEGRLQYHCTSVGYLNEKMRSALKEKPGYIIRYYDGEEFIEKFLEKFGDTNIRNDAAKKNKYLSWLRNGIEKEIIAARIFTENEDLKSDSKFEYFKRLLKNYEWDYSQLLELDNESFVVQCYREIAEREPDEGGYVTYCEMLYDGVPKEGILNIIGASPEVSQKKKIRNIELYGKVYNDYLLQKQSANRKKEKLKQVLRIPGNIVYICKMLYHNHLKDDNRYAVMRETLHTIEAQNQILLSKIDRLEQELLNLKKSE